jgi:hypothetical protein
MAQAGAAALHALSCPSALPQVPHSALPPGMPASLLVTNEAAPVDDLAPGTKAATRNLGGHDGTRFGGNDGKVAGNVANKRKRSDAAALHGEDGTKGASKPSKRPRMDAKLQVDRPYLEGQGWDTPKGRLILFWNTFVFQRITPSERANFGSVQLKRRLVLVKTSGKFYGAFLCIDGDGCDPSCPVEEQRVYGHFIEDGSECRIKREDIKKLASKTLAENLSKWLKNLITNVFA